MRWYALTSMVKSNPEGPQDRTGLAIVVLYVSAVMHLLPGLILLVLIRFDVAEGYSGANRETGLLSVVAALFIGLGALPLLLSFGLQRRRRWALIASSILFALYLPSLLLPLGVAGLFGTLSEGTRRRFRRRSLRVPLHAAPRRADAGLTQRCAELNPDLPPIPVPAPRPVHATQSNKGIARQTKNENAQTVTGTTTEQSEEATAAGTGIATESQDFERRIDDTAMVSGQPSKPGKKRVCSADYLAALPPSS